MSAVTAVAPKERDKAARHHLRQIKHLLDNTEVTEIAINEPGVVHYEKNSVWHSEPVEAYNFNTLKALGTAIATYAGQKWDASKPLLSAPGPDGIRVQLVLPPALSEDHISVTIRRPPSIKRTIDDFEAAGLLSEISEASSGISDGEKELKALLLNKKYAEFFKAAVRNRMNIVVSGATGSGKTTFMKGLVDEIPLSERLITIEDVRELFIPHKNAVHLLYSKGQQGTSDVTAKDLLESCLRMKPDRILLAEIRGDECLWYLRIAASGHPGSITSCHAGSPALAFEQLGLMIKSSPEGAGLDFSTIQRLLRLTIDIVVQFQNVGGKRRISEIYFDPDAKLRLSYGIEKL